MCGARREVLVHAELVIEGAGVPDLVAQPAHSDGEVIPFGKDPPVPERNGPELDPDLVAGGHRGSARGRHLGLHADRDAPPRGQSHGAGHDPVGAVRAHEVLRLVRPPVGGDVHALGALRDIEHAHSLVDLGPGLPRLQGQEMVEPVAHHHVRDRPLGSHVKGIQPLEGERRAGNRPLHDRTEIQIQNPVDLERQAPAAWLVARERLLLEKRDPQAAAGELVGGGRAARPRPDHDDVMLHPGLLLYAGKSEAWSHGGRIWTRVKRSNTLRGVPRSDQVSGGNSDTARAAGHDSRIAREKFARGMRA